MASEELTGQEVQVLIQTLFSTLKLMTDKECIGGIILTYDTYDKVLALFGSQAGPYKVNGVVLDPMKHNAFTVDKILFLRGTEVH